MGRKGDYQEEANRESLYGGVKFFAIAGVAASLMGYILGSQLLEYAGIIYLSIVVALLLALLDGYLKASPGG